MTWLVVYCVGMLHGVLLLQALRLARQWAGERTMHRWMDEDTS